MKFSELNKTQYIERFTPKHLKNWGPSWTYRVGRFFARFFVDEVSCEGEYLPKSPKLFLSTHTGGESGRIVAALGDESVHIVGAQFVNHDNRPIWHRIFFKSIGMVFIEETLSRYSLLQQKEIIKRAPEAEKVAYQRAAENKGASNAHKIRSIVALLIQGRNAVLYVEGLFSRLENDRRGVYGGFIPIAREYQRVTGKQLFMIPTVVQGNRVLFGEGFLVNGNCSRGQRAFWITEVRRRLIKLKRRCLS